MIMVEDTRTVENEHVWHIGRRKQLGMRLAEPSQTVGAQIGRGARRMARHDCNSIGRTVRPGCRAGDAFWNAQQDR